MDQVFNRQRFYLLMKLEYALNGKSFLLYAGVITGAMLVFMLPILGTVERRTFILYGLHVLPLFLCVILGGSLVTHTGFLRYSNPVSGMAAIMVPASRLEKFLVILLPRLILAVFLISLFLVLHYWIIDMANARLPDTAGKYGYLPERELVFLTYCYSLFQGFAFLGSIYFSKHAYVKSAAAFLISFITALGLQNWLAYSLTSNTGIISFPFNGWIFGEGRDFFLDFPQPVGAVVWAFLVLLVVSLVCIAFVRLKEKEI